MKIASVLSRPRSTITKVSATRSLRYTNSIGSATGDDDGNAEGGSAILNLKVGLQIRA